MAKDFTFKQFHIKGFNCGMPISTDAILLGAWANILDSESILDIGAGTGILSIMCAQRNALAQIKGVELDQGAFDAATFNYLHCPWYQRLQAIHAPIVTFTQQYIQQGLTVSAIICNPPYFNSGEKAENKQRALARHTDTLSHQDLIDCCGRLLKEKGKAHFVLPKAEGEAFMALVASTNRCGLTLTRLMNVKTTVNKPVTRLLIEFTKITQQRDTGCVDTAQLIIHEGEHYSEDFVALTNDFYLKL